MFRIKLDLKSFIVIYLAIQIILKGYKFYYFDRGTKIIESNYAKFIESDMNYYRCSSTKNMILKEKISHYAYPFIQEKKMYLWWSAISRRRGEETAHAHP